MGVCFSHDNKLQTSLKLFVLNTCVINFVNSSFFIEILKIDNKQRVREKLKTKQWNWISSKLRMSRYMYILLLVWMIANLWKNTYNLKWVLYCFEQFNFESSSSTRNRLVLILTNYLIKNTFRDKYKLWKRKRTIVKF